MRIGILLGGLCCDGTSSVRAAKVEIEADCRGMERLLLGSLVAEIMIERHFLIVSCPSKKRVALLKHGELCYNSENLTRDREVLLWHSQRVSLKRSCSLISFMEGRCAREQRFPILLIFWQ